MYQPPAFRENRRDILHDLIRSHPLATLVTAGSAGLIADLAPFMLVADADGGNAVLRGHLARGNDQLAALRAGGDALLIFQGPAAYVSPSVYPTKAEHGRVVPTWNYVIVQVRGVARVIDDPAWLRGQVDALTTAMEAGRPHPWRVDDAPAEFVAGQLRGIAGVEIPIQAIDGKWKVSQNQPEINREGVAAAMDGEHPAMAALVRGNRPG